MDVFAQFIAKWTHPDYPPEKIDPTQFAAVEARFGSLPQVYKDAVTKRGLPHTALSLLSAIVAGDLDLPDVSEFFSPGDILSETESWRSLGLLEPFVAFADDCSGNMFCFRSMGSSDAVWFFDHDFLEVDEVSPSFNDWIFAYCQIPEPYGEDRS
jgi:hypothetical protein